MNGQRYGIGELELASLAELRARVAAWPGLPGRLTLRVVKGDVRQLHQAPEYADALFQVASQFNLLEMTSPEVTPEMGVTRYQHDPTQGPACAIAAGAATLYRNYFVQVGESFGQTGTRQLDGLADLGAALSDRLGQPVGALWAMRNGYAMCSQTGLNSITRCLGALAPEKLDHLRGTLRIGIHSDVEVTDAEGSQRPTVSQAFCSALPVAYSRLPSTVWHAFARLVLEAAYEATIWAAVLNAQRGSSNILLLTRLGGGAFGNDGSWITDALARALRLAAGFELDVRLVQNRSVDPAMIRWVKEFS